MLVNSDCSSNRAAPGNVICPFVRWIGGICKRVLLLSHLVVIRRSLNAINARTKPTAGVSGKQLELLQ